MIDKRLIKTVGGSKKYIGLNVLFQWISLCANIFMIYKITEVLQKLYENKAVKSDIVALIAVVVLVAAVRFLCTVFASKMSYHSSKLVKSVLREKYSTSCLS